MKTRNTFVVVLVSLLAIAFVAGSALAAGDASTKKPTRYTAKNEPKPPRSGSLTMEIGQGAFLISAMGGHGALSYKGRTYPFKLGGLGIGGIGAQAATAEGEVYNLNRLEDFDGTYFQLEGGYAVVQGEGVLWLRNGNGVDLELRSQTKGLMMTVGAEGVVIKLSEK